MIDLSFVIQTAVANAISGIIQNLAIFILVIWGVRTIVRRMPEWLEEYFKLKERQDRIRWAKGET